MTSVVAVGFDAVAAEDAVVALLTTVTVVAVTRMRTGVAAWVRPMPRWCRRLPWRRVSLPTWSTVSWRMRKCALGWPRV